MYVGRIVAVARTETGELAALYRVSSRSFPNRHAVAGDQRVAIVPRPGHEADIQKNPYIAYNCYRRGGACAVVTNGSHTDFIADKLNDGCSVRDALVAVMHGMDFEHDHLSTPRISAVIDPAGNEAWLGIVAKDQLSIRRIEVKPGQASYVATYEHVAPGQYSGNFAATTATAGCQEILREGLFADLEKPVSAVAVFAAGDGFEMACKEADA